jgi:hypothetical protein
VGRRIFSLVLALIPFATALFGQQSEFRSNAFVRVQLVAPLLADRSNSAAIEKQNSLSAVPASGTDESSPDQTKPGEEPISKSKTQPKRILGVMPNYRAVSAGAIPPPPTLKQAFKIAAQNSFDYSAFLFTGFTSAIAYGEGTHKQLGDSPSSYWAYYWRGFVDKTDGNYLVIFALPTLFRQDERYYAMGKAA